MLVAIMYPHILSVMAMAVGTCVSHIV